MDRISSFIPPIERKRSSGRQGFYGHQAEKDAVHIYEVIEEVKSRCEKEKKFALASMVKFMTRKCQKEIALYTKRKDAEVKKILDEEKRIQNDLQKRMREMKKEGEQTSAGIQNLKSVLKFKRYQGVEKVKEEKKKLEEMLQAARDQERRKDLDMKSLRGNQQQLARGAKKSQALSKAAEKSLKERTNENANLNNDTSSSEYSQGQNKAFKEKPTVLGKKKNDRVQMARSKRESELEEKLAKLTGEYERLRTDMVRKLSEAQQAVAPLRQKSRQFIARNLELSARNRELESASVSSSSSVKRERQTQGRGSRSSSTNKLKSRILLGKTNFPDDISVEDYAGLYGHLQREYRDLCRAYSLLQARCGQNSIQDVEREERQINYYKNKLEAAETKMRDYDRCFNDTEGSDLIKKLIDEKESQTMKIFQMSEKLKMMEERELRLKTEVQDAKDQAELLEFRVLELEECQEKTRSGKNEETHKQDIGTETESDLIDSGCSSLRHSRCSSVTTELEDGHGQESKSDFGNEKIHETQQKLHALVSHVEGPSSKSLLIQTVALFEALLTRIKDLQNENEKLKSLKSIDEEGNKEVIKTNEELVLALESLNTKNMLLTSEKNEAFNQINQLTQSNDTLKCQLELRKTDEEKREETHRKFSHMQNKIEEDLRKELSCVSKKLNDTLKGSKSESEMYEEAILKVTALQTAQAGLKQSLADLEQENNQLRDQVSASNRDLAHIRADKSPGSGHTEAIKFEEEPDVAEAAVASSTGGSSGVWSVSSDDLESDHPEDVQAYIETLKTEVTELTRRLEEAREEVMEVKMDKANDITYDRLKDDDKAIENLQAELSCVSNCYNLLVTACYISWAMHHARPGPGYAITLLSDQDQSRLETQHQPGNELDLETREQLQQEIELLKIEKQKLIFSEEKFHDEKTEERVMMLERKLCHLEEQGQIMRDQHNKEKSVLERELENLQSKELSNTTHIDNLQRVVGEIEQELENVDCIIGESGIVGKIRYLVDNESRYSEVADKHEEKESAFRETLAEAEIIMTNIENNYKTKVAELEEENLHLQSKLTHSCDTSEFIRQHIQSSSAPDHSRALVDKLFEKEKNELTLMDKIFKLEHTINELSQKASDKEILKNELNDSMKDHEEILCQIQALTSENKELAEEAGRKKELDFKLQEAQQTEEFLRGRVEELETSEMSLAQSLTEAEQRSRSKERKLCEEINRLRDEINLGGSRELGNCENLSLGDESLKMECDSVKEKLRDMTCHLEEKYKQFQDTESSLRSELCKARSSISMTNQQLTDYDVENSQLKMKLTQLETDFKEKFHELEEMRNVMEQTHIEHSTLVTEKDRMIKSLQERMASDDSGDNALNSHLELAELSTSTGGGLQAVITDLRSVEARLRGCEDSEELRDKVSGAAAMLRSLTMVVEHDQSMVRAISEDNILDMDEDGATMTGTGDISIEEEESLLESQLVELTEKLDRMETEMVIVSEESKNLQQALEIRESTILDQRTQISELSQLVLTLERLIPSREAGARQNNIKIKRLQDPQKNSAPPVTKEVNLTLLPPDNLQILRRVGSDGLLISWMPPDDDEVTGYLIYVDNEQRQKVRSVGRTKALLHNLRLDTAMEVSVHSSNAGEEISEALRVSYSPDMELVVEKKRQTGNMKHSANNNNQSQEDNFQGAHL